MASINDHQSKALEAALLQIEKQLSKGSMMLMGNSSGINADIDVISTGSLGLDSALGIGDLPRGCIVEIYGNSLDLANGMPHAS